MKKTFLVIGFIFLSGLFFFSCNRNSENTAQPVDSTMSERDPMVRLFNDSIALNPNDPKLFYRRGLLFSQDTDFTNAINDFSKAIQLDGHNLKYRFAKIDILIQIARVNEAKNELLGITKIDSDNEEALTKLAKLNYYNRNYDEALRETDRLIKINPKNYEPYFIRATIQKISGDTQKAIIDFKQSVLLNPDLYEGYMQLGLLSGKKNPAAAEQFFNDAIKTDSQNVNPWIAKASLYEQLNENEKAKKVYQSLIARSVFNAVAFIQLGKIYLNEDSAQKAFESFNYAVRVSSSNYHAFYFRGVASEMMGEKKQAADDYAAALNLKPDFDSAKIAINRVQK
jgi:tetratricopeptide (TPR) repeat protein